MRHLIPLIVLAAAVSGCASMHGRKAAEDDTLPPVEPANSRVALYAACVHQASGDGGQVQKFGHLVRFTCTGAPARAMFDAAAVFAAARGRDETVDGVQTRYLASNKWDDHCQRTGDAYQCVVHLNVGAFLVPAEDTPPQKSK